MYLEMIRSEGGMSVDLLDQRLRSHQINPTQLWKDDFEAFFAERKAALLTLIQVAMGKTPVAETVEAEPVEDNEESE